MSLVARLPGLLFPPPHFVQKLYTFFAGVSLFLWLREHVLHGVKLLVSGALWESIRDLPLCLPRAIVLYMPFIFSGCLGALRACVEHGVTLSCRLVSSRALKGWHYIAQCASVALLPFLLFRGLGVYYIRRSESWAMTINADLVFLAYYFIHNVFAVTPILRNDKHPWVWRPALGSPPLHAALHTAYILFVDTAAVSYLALRITQTLLRHRILLLVRRSGGVFKTKFHTSKGEAFGYMPLWTIIWRGRIQVVVNANGSIVIRSPDKVVGTTNPGDSAAEQATETPAVETGLLANEEAGFEPGAATSETQERARVTSAVCAGIDLSRAQVPPTLCDPAQAQDPPPKAQEDTSVPENSKASLLDLLRQMRNDLQADVDAYLSYPEEHRRGSMKRHGERAIAVAQFYDLLIEREGRVDCVVREEARRLRESGIL